MADSDCMDSRTVRRGLAGRRSWQRRDPLGAGSVRLTAFTAALALGIFVSNEVHAAAHARPSELPGWVRRLQRAGVIQSPLHHAAHHRALKNVNFCTLTDWTNPVLERVRLWRRLEALIRLSRGIRTRRDPVVRRQQRRRWRSA